jgi:hypothetical protein
MQIARVISIASLALAPLAAAHAQQRTYTITGSGSLEIGRVSRRVERVDMTLTDRGDFAATVFSEGDRYDLRGRWSRRGGPGADERIQLDAGFGDSRANGSGVLTFRENRSPRSIEISGQARGGRFRLGLEGDIGGIAGRGPRDDTPWYGTRQSVSASTSGRGTVRYGRDGGRVSGASVQLLGNGEAIVRVSGNAQLDASGRWERADGDTYRIRVSRINGGSASGTLTVDLRDRGYSRGGNGRDDRYDRRRADRADRNGSGSLEIASIQGDGRVGRDRFSVDFDGR